MEKPDKDISEALAILKKHCPDGKDVEHYYKVLSNCDTAQEIANKVIKPLFASHCIKEADARSESFYLPLARLADPAGTKIKRNTMYDNVCRVIKEVKRETRSNEMRYHVGKYSNGCDIRMLVHPDGFTEVTANLQFATMDPQLVRLLMPALEYLQASLKEVREKHFDARGDSVGSVYDVECPIEDMPILIRYMQTLVPGGNMVVSYFSPYTEQKQIGLEEALEIAQTEADENDEQE